MNKAHYLELKELNDAHYEEVDMLETTIKEYFDIETSLEQKVESLKMKVRNQEEYIHHLTNTVLWLTEQNKNLMKKS
jgi:hypothetical protein